MDKIEDTAINELQSVLQTLKDESSIHKVVDEVVACIESNGTIFTCGNGGSASDAQHLSAELVGRYNKERKGFRAICLNADTSALTAIGNDYGYKNIFKRQLESIARKGDILIAISSSGNSENVIEVSKYAQEKGITTIGLLGKGGGKQKNFTDIPIIIQSDSTARVQEIHGFLIHVLCEHLDEKYA